MTHDNDHCRDDRDDRKGGGTAVKLQCMMLAASGR
jgi:hypothetical protein